MTEIRVISFAGRDLETGYSAHFRIADAVRTRTVSTSFVTPNNRRPVLAATHHTPVTIPVQIHITSGTLLDQLDQLDQWLVPGTAGDLRIRIGDDDVRRVPATVSRTLPFDGGANKFTVVFAVPDGRWLSDAKECWDGGGLQWSGNEITDTTRATGTEGDGFADVDRVGVWEGTTNLVLNGGLETNTDGYLAYGTNTIAVSTEQAKFGSQSLKCTVGNTNRMMVYGGAASAATTYSISAWIYIPSSWTGVVDPAFTILHTVGTSTVDFRVTADVTVKDQWQRMTCRVLTGGTVSDIGIEIGFPSGGTATEFVYIDGLQMEALNHPTPYVETDGGTASRSDARVQINAAELDETTGWAAFRVRSGFSEDPSGSQVHPIATLFDWYDSTSNRLWLRYEDSTSGTGNWRFLRRGSGVGTGAQTSAALALGQSVTVIARWTATTIGTSVDGAAFDDQANAGIPALSATLADLGSAQGTSEHWDGDIVWFAAGTGTLTDADAAEIAASGNTLPSRWPETAARCLTWLANDLVDDQVQIHATNDGTVETDDLVLTVQPLSAKPGTNDWIYRREVIVANRCPRALPGWAVELTGGWDHAAEVSAGRSQADGDDVRVYLDGTQIPRWSGGAGTADWNQTGTKIWATIPHSPGREAELLDAMASASVPAAGSQITFPGGTLAGWPSAGHMLIGSEVVRYSSATADAVTVVERGARGTTAAAHSSGAAVFWVEHRVEVIYGNVGASAPANADHLKPMIDLQNSTNLEHTWLDFADTENPRTMQWARVLRTRDSQSDKMLSGGGSPVTAPRVRFRAGGPVAGAPNFNGWARAIPCGTRYGASNHAMTVNNLIVDPSIIAQIYGTDGDGNEVPLLNDGLGATDINASTDTDDPSAPVYAIELSARNGIVVGSPGSEYNYSGGLPGIDISSTDGRITSGTFLAQPFTVPEALDDIAYIDKIGLLARTEPLGTGVNNSILLDVSIAQDDGAGGYVAIGTGQVTVTSNNPTSINHQWYTVTLTDRVRVRSGEQLYVLAEWNSVTAGSPTYVEWYTTTASYEGLLLSHAMRVYSSTLDAGPDAVGLDGDDMTAQAATIYYDDIDDRYPYVAFGSQQSLYWLDGTLTNAATGASVTFSAPVSLLDEVVIDVAARTVRNVTEDVSALNAVAFSSGDWIDIQPGANLLTYTEDSMVSVRVAAEWSHRWQS